MDGGAPRLGRFPSSRDRRKDPSAGRGRRGPGHLLSTRAAAAVILVAGLVPAVALVPTPAFAAAPEGAGFNLNAGDVRFILDQIKIAERHAATASPQNPCGTLRGNGANQVPNPLLPYGLRTVDGSCNNLLPSGGDLGRAQRLMPRLADPVWRDGEDSNVPGIGPVGPPGHTSYAQKSGSVVDSQPRVISNLVVDQTSSNPAAVQAATLPRRSFDHEPTAVPCTAPGVPEGCTPDGETLLIPNISTDAGLSPPFNSWFTLFGQFFDHGLDLAIKGGSGAVVVPLKDDDPLIAGPDREFGTSDDLPPEQRFMVLTRATNRPGTDGQLGTADDVHEATNNDTPWVDQNQTYGSHPAHQVFLRQYAVGGSGAPVSTGGLIQGASGGMATWAEIKAQAAELLGIDLVDTDVTNVPLLVTDPYGRFARGANGFPLLVTDNGTVEGNPANPISTASALRSGIAFLDDIAHHAAPRPGLIPDADTVASADFANQEVGAYDDEMLDAHFISGDGRINENIGLTAMHQMFHSEHNRLVSYIENLIDTQNIDEAEWRLSDGSWNGERIFQAARFVTEMEYQHLVFEEFARKVQPGLDLFTAIDPAIDPAINAEFAHAVYRFGHSMLTDTIDRSNAPDIPLLQGFLNPLAYTDDGRLSAEAAAGGLAMGMTDQTGNEIDEFVTETLRNNLLGLPLDLPAINITRGREAGVPPFNEFRRQLFTRTRDSSLRPYSSWSDFGLNLKHPYSLVNLVAAYGTHPSIAGGLAQRRAAAELLVNGGAGAPGDRAPFLDRTGSWADRPTGLDLVDLWVGGLAESTRLFGGMLGSTFSYVFEQQMLKLQDGDRFYYLARLAGLNLFSEIEGNSFAEMIMRNTDAEALKADVFGIADCEFDLANLGTSGPVTNDPASACDESQVLTRMPDGTVRYRPSNPVDPPGLNPQSTFNGTTAGDRFWGGVDDDTFWGNDGDDWIEGDDGDDTAIGGLGDDTLTDVNGTDVLKGGRGDDAIDAGPGLDIIVGGLGNDFTSGGVNADEIFAGPGNDLIETGGGDDTVLGDSGDDWVEGGAQADEIFGDSAAPLFDDLNAPGDDVIAGQAGDDALAAEGGDDILLAGPGVDENIGLRGFDWVAHVGDPAPADADLSLELAPLPPPGGNLQDRYGDVEALSGWSLDDVLRGDDAVPATDIEPGVPVGSNVLTARGIDMIDGLQGLLPTGSTSFGGGNIILGGAGSDRIEGRGGDDVIDGDRWLDVRLETTTGQTFTDLAALRDAALAGTVDPGNVVTVREIRDPLTTAGDVDTATFSDVRANYTVTTAGAVTTVTHHPVPVPGGEVPVNDGTDTLRGIERLIFADAIVPAQPDDLVVTTNAGDRSATITWSGPAADAADRFEVHWEDPVSGLDRVRDAGSADGVTINSLVNGRTYHFQVWAFHAQPPNPRWLVPTGPVVPASVPGAPTIGTATGRNGSALVRWSPPVDDGGADVTHYLVRTQDAAGNLVGEPQSVSAPATRAVVSGLTNGIRYRFQVAAVNAAGPSTYSEPSNTVRSATVPDAPVIGTARAGETGDVATTANAFWSPPPFDGGARVTGYVVTALRMSSTAPGARVLQRTSSGPLASGRRSHAFRLAPGVYRFRVVARNVRGDSPPSARSNAVRAR
jgi:Ca2+-binding RTX toxin-like protein